IEVAPAWLHSKYTDFRSANPADPFNPTPVVLDGNQLIQAPELPLNSSMEYGFAVGSGTLTLRGELNWQDRIYFTPFNEAVVSRPANTKINAFVRYEMGNWNLSVYGRNLANKTTIASALVNSIAVGLPVSGTLEPPRTYGIKIGYHF
ncbi:MAG: TonB-dependent receptor, partial [Sphingobium sp.]|nr:TonB-dependent receptor [Sphingobium sp.]